MGNAQPSEVDHRVHHRPRWLWIILGLLVIFVLLVLMRGLANRTASEGSPGQATSDRHGPLPR